MDEQEIKLLVDRYFEGITTESEERSLRQYVASVDDHRFDEVRAVMGFAEMSRAKRRRSRSASLRSIGVAASIALLVGGACFYSAFRSDNVCIAYIGGEKCTEQTVVMEQMKRSFHSVMPTSNDEQFSPEAQLKSLFKTSDNGYGED